MKLILKKITVFSMIVLVLNLCTYDYVLAEESASRKIKEFHRKVENQVVSLQKSSPELGLEIITNADRQVHLVLLDTASIKIDDKANLVVENEEKPILKVSALEDFSSAVEILQNHAIPMEQRAQEALKAMKSVLKTKFEEEKNNEGDNETDNGNLEEASLLKIILNLFFSEAYAEENETISAENIEKNDDPRTGIILEIIAWILILSICAIFGYVTIFLVHPSAGTKVADRAVSVVNGAKALPGTIKTKVMKLQTEAVKRVTTIEADAAKRFTALKGEAGKIAASASAKKILIIAGVAAAILLIAPVFIRAEIKKDVQELKKIS